MQQKKWGQMYMELMCNLMCSLPPFLIEKHVWNETKVSFLKHYDILSIFK